MTSEKKIIRLMERFGRSASGAGLACGLPMSDRRLVCAFAILDDYITLSALTLTSAKLDD